MKNKQEQTYKSQWGIVVIVAMVALIVTGWSIYNVGEIVVEFLKSLSFGR